MSVSKIIQDKSYKFLTIGSLLFLTIGVVNCSENAKKEASQYQADNSGKNVRDTAAGTVTPESQKENENDLNITQKIRQALVADDSLSTNAKNVKIITSNGKVTLRGPVNSQDEKEKIVTKAKQIVDSMNINNQLEIKNQ